MRFGRVLPALSVLLVTASLIVLTGTGAAANQPARPAPAAHPTNLAGPAALDSYLRSIGISRVSLVTQRGARNYAGPNCPGKGWNCTTSTRVLQIAQADGQNKVDCPPGSVVTGSSQSCVVVQTGANNSAKCHQRSSSDAAVQHCSITQTGVNNRADVHQTVHAEKSNEQTATQTAVVKQTSTGGSNESKVHQDVKQKSKEKDASSQSQDVQQSADIDQTATGAGSNSSNLHQSQNLSAKGAAANQEQNTDNLGVADCAFAGALTPNACANVNQSSDAGNNESRLKQSIKEDAKSHVLANQQQGSFTGGIAGRVHQETATGSSSNRANQDKAQKLSAPAGSSQTQYDPVYCCGVGSQLGGTGNSDNIDQSSTQDASEADAFQQIALLGESMTPTGVCSVTQSAKNNSDSTTNSASIEPCPFLQVFTACASGGGDFDGEGDVVILSEHEPEGTCTAFPPVTVPPECTICIEGGQIDAVWLGRQNR